MPFAPRSSELPRVYGRAPCSRSHCARSACPRFSAQPRPVPPKASGSSMSRPASSTRNCTTSVCPCTQPRWYALQPLRSHWRTSAPPSRTSSGCRLMRLCRCLLLRRVRLRRTPPSPPPRPARPPCRAGGGRASAPPGGRSPASSRPAAPSRRSARSTARAPHAPSSRSPPPPPPRARRSAHVATTLPATCGWPPSFPRLRRRGSAPVGSPPAAWCRVLLLARRAPAALDAEATAAGSCGQAVCSPRHTHMRPSWWSGAVGPVVSSCTRRA